MPTSGPLSENGNCIVDFDHLKDEDRESSYRKYKPRVLQLLVAGMMTMGVAILNVQSLDDESTNGLQATKQTTVGPVSEQVQATTTLPFIEANQSVAVATTVGERERTTTTFAEIVAPTQTTPTTTISVTDGRLVCGLPESFSQSGIDTRTHQGKIDFHNWERARYGLSPLIESAELNQVAQRTAAWLVSKNAWEHPGKSTGVGVNLSLVLLPKIEQASENLGVTSTSYTEQTEQCRSDDLMGAFMRSPAHKASILDTASKFIGVATNVYPEGSGLAGQTLVVVEFAG